MKRIIHITEKDAQFPIELVVDTEERLRLVVKTRLGCNQPLRIAWTIGQRGLVDDVCQIRLGRGIEVRDRGGGLGTCLIGIRYADGRMEDSLPLRRRGYIGQRFRDLRLFAQKFLPEEKEGPLCCLPARQVWDPHRTTQFIAKIVIANSGPGDIGKVVKVIVRIQDLAAKELVGAPVKGRRTRPCLHTDDDAS